jgi:hypothetical protein
VVVRILRIVGVGVGLATIFLAVLLAARLLEHTDPAFREMLTALSTLVLVLVTGVYVYLTFRLVRAQEQPLRAIRLAAQESAVRVLVSSIVRNQPSVAVLSGHFPLDLAQQLPPALEPSDVDALERLTYEVGAAASQLPGPLVARCLETAELAAKAYVNVASLISLIETFENTHMRWATGTGTMLVLFTPRSESPSAAPNGTTSRLEPLCLRRMRRSMLSGPS